MGYGGEIVLKKRAEDDDIGQGLPVIKGTADDQVKLPAAAGNRPQGITLYEAFEDAELAVVVSGPVTAIAGAPIAVDDYVKIGDTDEIQVVTIDGVATDGTFTLTYAADATAALDHDASAAEVQAGLEGTDGIGAGDVTVTGEDGGPWTVVFGTLLAGTDLALMVGDGANLLPDPLDVLVTEKVKGGFKGHLVPTTTKNDEVAGKALSPADQDGDEFLLDVCTQLY